MKDDRVLACIWCGQTFETPRSRGPVPRYCSNSCRQRAYESRRGPAVAAPRERPVPTREILYEGGWRALSKFHALDPDPTLRDSRGWRPTLCGMATVQPSPRPFRPGAKEACGRCTAIARARPPDLWRAAPVIRSGDGLVVLRACEVDAVNSALEDLERALPEGEAVVFEMARRLALLRLHPVPPEPG